MVHVLWDPMQACAAQWPQTLAAGNVSFDTLCRGVRIESLAALYKLAKRHRTRSLQLRLEDVVGAGRQKAPWRQLFKFLELPEKAADLSAIGTRAVVSLRLHDRVLNSAAPSWVRDAIAANATTLAYLRRLQRDLDYAGEGASAGQGGGRRRRA